MPFLQIIMQESISNSDLLLLSLTNYYSKNNNLKTLTHIVDNESHLSLRLIDWYVTNYCKQHNIAYVLAKDGKQEYFNVYMNYRSQLKAFKKVLFDPFRRRSRITFHYEKENAISTTIGQLNFFRWAIDNKIIDNLKLHLHDVEKDMLSRQKHDKITNSSTQELDLGLSTSGIKGWVDTESVGDTTQRITKKRVGHKNSIKTMTRFKGNTLISFK